jgi:hypothetical protein
MSPGRIYDERLMQLEARTGEDLTQSNGTSSPTLSSPDQSNTAKTMPDLVEENYQRPVLGQD